MREKKNCVVITFYTTAAAMAMEKRCRELDLPGRLAPAPRSVTADCGMAWIAPAESREMLENAPGLPELAGICERML